MDPSTPQGRILVVDDEVQTAHTIEHMARHFGYDVVVAGSVEAAIQRFAESSFDVVLTDVQLGRRNGFDLLRHILQRAPQVPVVLITGYATIDAAMEAIEAGAYDYFPKPAARDALGALLKRAIEKRRVGLERLEEPAAPPAAEDFDYIAGNSAPMIEVYKTVARVASGRSNVLIFGESGTGKELVARALHRRSARSERRFVPVNVSAIPEGLLESELFGHVKGAFTGATTTRRGLFEEAHQGTLFLDEIGDLSLPLQAKLLRAIQEQRVKPVGGNEEIDVDVRILAATHQNLEEMVRSGRFREDLYYRLNVVSITLPPLRERREDIPILLDHFLRKYVRESGRPAQFSADALRVLTDYSWPGNVRELVNVVERAVLLSTHGLITPEVLPPGVADEPGAEAQAVAESAALSDVIQRHVLQVLERTGGNRTQAARILGISRRTLHRMAQRLKDSKTDQWDNLSRDGTI
jgi:DNA-binding NtrC family response regulator